MTSAHDPATGAEAAAGFEAGRATDASSDLAVLCEGSEARAYTSLVAAARAAPGFEVARQGAVVMLRSTAVRSSLLFNRVLGLGLGTPARAADIDGVCSWYAADGLPFGVELSPAARPAELPDWLRAQRLRKRLPTQVLVRNGSAPPPHYAPWARMTGLRVDAVGPDAAATVARVSCENFAMPAAVADLLTLGSQAPGWRRWLALDGQTAVGASLSYVEDGVAWLGWTSVLPSHRGRWVHAGIVARQLQDAFESGCQWVTTETAQSSPAQPDPAYFNLRKFGFADAYLRPVYVYVPARRQP
jgi:hypothetical protein